MEGKLRQLAAPQHGPQIGTPSVPPMTTWHQIITLLLTAFHQKKHCAFFGQRKTENLKTTVAVA